MSDKRLNSTKCQINYNRLVSFVSGNLYRSNKKVFWKQIKIGNRLVCNQT